MAEMTTLGRYKLIRVLGRGAMGVVYEGLDPALNRRVAVKTILRNAAIDEQTAQAYSAQFTREAQAAGRLSHPNIVQVHDFALEGEVAYLVMEYIQGRELRSFFEAKEKFEPAEAVRVMGELLDALDFAHDAGVVHRDVKPANVMLDAQRRVKLADFGVARIQDSERSAAGTMVGTPAFMSPEQIQGAKIDRRTDIFSAGVVLYQLLTGEQPFTGTGAWTVAKKIMQDDPPRVSTVAVSVSPAFDAIVNKALAKNPAERYANAREFAAALRAAGATAQPSFTAQPSATGQLPASSTLPPGQPAMAKPGAKATEAEVEFWRAIQNSGDAAEFEFYLEQFPEGTYAPLARHKIGKLKEPGESARKAAEELARQETEAQEALRRQEEEAQEVARLQAEAEERKREESETRARVEAEVKAQREAAEKAKRAAEEKARQAAALAKLKAQEEAARAAAAPAADPDATVAISRPAPPAGVPPVEGRKSFVLPAAIAAVVVVAGTAAFLVFNRKPAPEPAPVAAAPAAVPARPEPPVVDEAKIRREVEEKLRREYADKSVAEQAAAKVAAEKGLQEKLLAAKAAAEKAALEKAAADKLQAEKMAAAKSAGERAALEKAAADKAAADKVAADKAAAEKAAAAKAAVPAKPGFPGIGDRWVYEVRETNRPDKKYELQVDANGISENSIQELATSKTGIHTTRTHGAALNLTGMAPGLAVFAPYVGAFHQLRAGEKLNVGSITVWACSGNASCAANARVTGREPVTVRAGAYDAWKIVIDVQFAFGGGFGGMRGAEMTFWYAESAKRMVKYQMRQVTGMAWNHPDTTMELVSYTPAGGR